MILWGRNKPEAKRCTKRKAKEYFIVLAYFG